MTRKLHFGLLFLPALFFFFSFQKAEIQDNPHRYVTARSGLRLRNAPAPRAKKILTIPYGSKVELNGKKGNKVLFIEGIEGIMIGVKYDGREGYVFEGFLQPWPVNTKHMEAVFHHHKGRWGFVSEGTGGGEIGSGNWVIKPQYRIASDFFARRAAVVKMSDEGEVTCIIDEENKVVKELDYMMTWYHFDPSGEDFPEGFSDGRLLVQASDTEEPEDPKVLRGGYGFVDLEGEVVIPVHFTHAEAFREGRALVNVEGELREYSFNKGGKWFYIDVDGKQAFEGNYDYGYSFTQGRAAVLKGEKWGFIDRQGNEIYPIEADDVQRFSDGMAWVKKGKYWSAIDRTGKEIIMGPYLDVSGFESGHAYVNVDSEDEKKAGCWRIDKQGNLIKKVDCDVIFGGC